jgi:hypothetical protein
VYPVGRPRVSRRGRQHHDEAVRRLRTSRPPYTQVAAGYSRERMIRAQMRDVGAVVTHEVNKELIRIIESGILDDDVLYAS